MGCDFIRQALGAEKSGFNPRTHMGCDCQIGHGRNIGDWFQSTHPHGVRRHKGGGAVALRYGFNPRTHMGCDGFSNANSGISLVSIHAPTWGATSNAPATLTVTGFNPRTHMGCDNMSGGLLVAGAVSIHAPTWGATSMSLLSVPCWKFQSTHPHGVRQSDCTVILSPFLFQSTHPHGVRLTIAAPLQLQRCFNPRTHMGCDCMQWGMLLIN